MGGCAPLEGTATNNAPAAMETPSFGKPMATHTSTWRHPAHGNALARLEAPRARPRTPLPPRYGRGGARHRHAQVQGWRGLDGRVNPAPSVHPLVGAGTHLAAPPAPCRPPRPPQLCRWRGSAPFCCQQQETAAAAGTAWGHRQPGGCALRRMREASSSPSSSRSIVARSSQGSPPASICTAPPALPPPAPSQ